VCRVCVCARVRVCVHDVTHPIGAPHVAHQHDGLGPLSEAVLDRRDCAHDSLERTERDGVGGRAGGCVSEGVGNDGWRMRGMFGALQTSTCC
jgi:hypothetical protein